MLTVIYIFSDVSFVRLSHRGWLLRSRTS